MKTPGPWQQSHFVDHVRYSGMPRVWKEARQREELMTVRGPGVIGSPGCNVLFWIDGPEASPGLTREIVTACNAHDALVEALETLLRPIEACQRANSPSHKQSGSYSLTFSAKQIEQAQKALALAKAQK